MKNNIKRSSLIMNVLAIVVVSAILIGSTFAWFTDSAISTGNKIQAGTLKVDLELLDRENGWVSLKTDSNPIFNYDKWEPGYTDIKILKIENEGSLALKWKAKFVSETELSALAEVIDVYVLPSATELAYPADRSLDGYSYVGTVKDFVNSIETTTTGTLLAGEVSYLGIALKMRTDAGNEYQGLNLGGEDGCTFDIMIVATQLSSEADGFNNQYDSEASLDFMAVSSPNQLKIALANKETNILLTEDIVTTESFVIDYDVNINGNNNALSRQNTATFASREAAATFTGPIFTVAAGKTLELSNIVVDGGAIWTGDRDDVLKRGTENVGITTTESLITAAANSQIILGEGAIVQNNDGAVAINLGTRIGATLVINGGEVINNNSNAGAIWGGGHITLNSGKINYNSSTGLAGAIRMVSSCNFTMNGGEIKNNKAATDGGVFWGYGTSTYNFNGGEISGNNANVGGVMYSGDNSVININNDFKMINNTANQAGAFRLENRTTLNINGGVISGNVSTAAPSWDAIYGWNPAVNISAGILADNITIHGGLTPTIGGTEIDGTIYFALGTNHNTCYLKPGFGVIKFSVAEGNNFAAFNFTPEASYTYTEGDENKLICINEGYTTYYDTTTKTFRLKAID